MKTKGLLITLALAPALLLGPVGCETMQEHKIASGAAIGTLAGAGVGALIGSHGGNAGKGALIGAAAGGLLGTGVGYYLDRQAKQLQQIQGVEVEKAPAGPVEVAPPPVPDAPAPVRQAPEHLSLKMNSELLFQRGSSALTPQGTQKLAEIAATLAQYPNSDVIVKGYTSSEGGDALNMDLSKRRAEVVRNTLIANRVAPERVSALGMGASDPIASNATENGRMQNRRVIIDVIPREEVR